MQRYLLQPPFLIVNEETNFSDVWESFCLKLLKLEYGTNEIERRRPPESGIDLFYKRREIAFQCKSTTASSPFNLTHASRSLRSALPLKSKLPWSRYVFCSNENPTEPQLAALRAIDPGAEILGKDHWIGLCRRFPEQVKANFRTVCDVPENRIHRDLQLLINGELDNIKEKLKIKPIKVLIYHHAHDQIYEFVLSRTLTISDLLLIARRLFQLHETTKDYKGEILAKPYISIDNVRYDEERQHDSTLEELGIDDYATLLFGLDIAFPRAGITRTVMYANKPNRTLDVIESEIVASIFKRFNESLRGE